MYIYIYICTAHARCVHLRGGMQIARGMPPSYIPDPNLSERERRRLCQLLSRNHCLCSVAYFSFPSNVPEPNLCTGWRRGWEPGTTELVLNLKITAQ